MLRDFRSGVPEPKIPQRFFAGMGSNMSNPSVRSASKLYSYFPPEGRFMIFCWIPPRRDAAKIMKHSPLPISEDQCRLAVKSSLPVPNIVNPAEAPFATLRASVQTLLRISPIPK